AAEAGSLGGVGGRRGELPAAVPLRPGDQVRAGAQGLAGHRHVPRGQDSVLVRLAERHRPASFAPSRAQAEVPGWTEWASLAITTPTVSRSAARWSMIEARSPSAHRPELGARPSA